MATLLNPANDGAEAFCNPRNRDAKKASDSFTYKKLVKRDKANLPEPGVLALEITEGLEAAPEQFAVFAEDLKV